MSRSNDLLAQDSTDVSHSCVFMLMQIRIELPFEQAISPSIDTITMMKTFAVRRTALIWNARGIVVFPGGLGTLNELFEAWRAAINRKVVLNNLFH